MGKQNYAVKLDTRLLERLRGFCEEKGFKQTAFVEKALRAQMDREELQEDLGDLLSLRPQERLARPFREYVRKRK
jgi:hypothetical protein